MADSRVRLPVKITDPTTDANEAAVDASGNLQVILAANTGVDIGDVDVTSVLPGSAAANLGKAEDVASAGGDVGVASFAVQDSALSALTSIDGDYTWLRVDANGALWTHDDALDAALAGSELQVDVVAALPTGANTIGAVNLAEAETDDAGVSVGGSVLMAGLVFDDTTPVVIEEGDAGYQRMSLNRNAYQTIRDAAGAERGVNVTAANEMNVIATAQPGVDIGDVDILSVIPGSGATNLGKAENVASAGGDVGVAAMAIQDAALTALGSIDGDYTHLRVNANGALHVTGGGGGTEVNEDAASAGGELGSLALGYRQDADTSPVSLDGDFHGLIFDANGALKVNVKSGGGEALPTNPVLTEGNSTNTAAGATFDMDGPSSDSTTKTVRGFDAAASVPFKAELMQVDNDVETVHATQFGDGSTPVSWRAAHRDFHDVTFGGTAGFDGFRVKVTNLDNSKAADLYATLYTED